MTPNSKPHSLFSLFTTEYSESNDALSFSFSLYASHDITTPTSNSSTRLLYRSR